MGDAVVDVSNVLFFTGCFFIMADSLMSKCLTFGQVSLLFKKKKKQVFTGRHSHGSYLTHSQLIQATTETL